MPLEIRSQRPEAGSLEPEARSQKPDGARDCGDGEPRGLRQAARPERSEGLLERVPSGRDDNNVGGRASEAGGQRPEAGAEPADDAGEEAEVATKPETNSASETNRAPPPDDEGYVWPEGAEAAPEEENQKAAAPEIANAPLPSLDELVKRIPADVRETLDDLFRVKFTGVKRVSPMSLKS